MCLSQKLSSLCRVELILLTVFWKLNTVCTTPSTSPNDSDLYITLFAHGNLNESFDIFQAEFGF